MMLIEQEVNRLLKEAQDPGPILRGIYETYKKHKKSVSLAFICRRAGIPSKGYLSFVMAGERRLNEKYWDTVCTALKLTTDQSEVLKLLLLRDSDPRPGPHLEQAIAVYRQRLN